MKFIIVFEDESFRVSLMKIVRTYSLLIPAQLGQLELGSYGVKSVILDEGLAVMAPQFAMSDGIRLAVAEEDLQQAREILDAAREKEC